MKFTFFSFALAGAVSGRRYAGDCLDYSKVGIAEAEWNPELFAGTWFEVMRDRFTFFEWTGKCNRNVTEYVAPELDKDGKPVYGD